jgi:hypothetical protein
MHSTSLRDDDWNDPLHGGTLPTYVRKLRTALRLPSSPTRHPRLETRPPSSQKDLTAAIRKHAVQRIRHHWSDSRPTLYVLHPPAVFLRPEQDCLLQGQPACAGSVSRKPDRPRHHLHWLRRSGLPYDAGRRLTADLAKVTFDGREPQAIQQPTDVGASCKPVFRSVKQT